MTKRLNSTRPGRTGALMDRIADEVERSRLITRAVRRDVGAEGQTNLHDQLREGAQARAERDLHLAAAWLALGDSQPNARR